MSDGRYNRRGGFHDLPSFRAETGVTQEELSDEDAYKLLYEDAKQQKEVAMREEKTKQQRLADEKKQVESERQRLRQQLSNRYDVNIKHDNLARQHDILRHEYNKERGKRQLYESVLNPYYTTDPTTAAAQYIQRENLKKEIKRELEEEDKLKRLSSGRNKWGEPVNTRQPPRSTRKPRSTKSSAKSTTKRQNKSSTKLSAKSKRSTRKPRPKSKSKRKPRKKSKPRSRSRGKQSIKRTQRKKR